jgi:hypothetical protein
MRKGRVSATWRTVAPGQVLRWAAIGLLAIGLAMLAAAGPLKTYADKRNPFLAIRLFDSAESKIRLWFIATASAPRREPSASVIGDAREALRNNPSNATALAALAMYFSLKEDGRGETFAELSHHVTRRQRVAQIILGQAAARDEDVEGAMQHLSTALQTTERGRDDIFALLANLANQPDFQRTLRPFVTEDNVWISDFLSFALRHSSSGPVTVAGIMLAADPAKSMELQEKVDGELFGFLVEQGRFDLLHRLYPLMLGKKADISKTPSFTEQTIDPVFGWLSWFSASDASLGTEFTREDDRIVPVVYANEGDRGVALKRVMLLRPGRYVLDEQRTLLSGDERGSATWRIACPDGRELKTIWTGPSDRLDYSTPRAGLEVTIPAGCTTQVFELTVRDERGSQGFELLIDRFDLRRRS